MLSPNWIPNVPVGIVAVIIGAGGVIISFKPPTARWRYVVAALFVILCVAECCFIWKQSSQSNKESEDQRNQIGKLTADLQNDQLQNSRDLGYMKGRLDQALAEPRQTYDFSELGRAIAKTNADYISEERKVYTDKQLSQNAISLAKQMREFEMQSQTRSNALLMGPLSQPPQGSTQDQTNAFYRDRQAVLSNASLQVAEQFRSLYLPRAVQLLDEIASRLKAENKVVPPLARGTGLAFDGILAGISPISDSADYLELLARQLHPL